tara:strand:- start:7494 stop:8750 length:1257 start_codon:yes stop_codon:yes gene_type:complete
MSDDGQSEHSESSETDMSHKESTNGSSSRPVSLASLCEYVHAKLGADSTEVLPVKAHKSAVSAMERIHTLLLSRNSLSASTKPSQASRMFLLYSGIAIRRRIILCQLNEFDLADLKTTMSLLFVLQLLFHGHAQAQQGDIIQEEDRPDDPLNQWTDATLEQIVNDTSGWGVDAPMVCQDCLRLGPVKCTSIAATSPVAELFFRCSSAMLQYSMLEGLQPSQSFLGLDSVDFLMMANRSNQNQNLKSIVELAESEAGQAILRDMILSFTLPQSVVGVRHGALLGRDSNRAATERHPTVLNEAHEAAMRGAAWEFEHNTSDVVKMCCLLSGLAIMLMPRKGDVRKDSAFEGRVLMPFLEPPTVNPGVKRLILLPQLGEWAVFSMDRKGKPVVHLRDTGLDGLGQCVLLLSKEQRKKDTER